MFSENKQVPGHSNIKVSFQPDIETGRDMLHVTWLDSKDEMIRRVKPADIERWPQQWAIYDQAKANMVKVDGPYVSDIPMMERGVAMSLRLKGIITVDQLATLDDFAAISLDAERGKQWRDAAMMYQLAHESKPAKKPGRPKKEPEDQPQEAA